MAEANTTPAAAGTPAEGQDPKNPEASTGSQPEQGAATSTFDPSKVSDNDFEKVFEDSRLFRHPRFKSLAERAKVADKLEKDTADAEKKRLEDEGKWKERTELAEKEAADAKLAAQEATIRSAIQGKAAALGVVDLDAAAVLIDRSSIKVEDGAITGVDEALTALLEAKPYLKGKPQAAVGTGSNPSQTEGGVKKFKLSQIQDAKFYQTNEKDILEALKLGLVEDDVHAPQPA